ncbi:hypothetical protein ACHMW4_04055 [Mesorhizobium sp. UC22_110]|uniref:hypothetical protein n=1 Tax=unclassified Mesorhizobium TaxID=325217 RepID=UPI0036712286
MFSTTGSERRRDFRNISCFLSIAILILATPSIGICAEASPGPSKTGFYVVDLTCPSGDGELIVMQMNRHNQTRRTKAEIRQGNATRVTIEAAEGRDDFKLIFPNKNDFTESQRVTVTGNIRKFLTSIYSDVCLDRSGNRASFLDHVRQNKSNIKDAAN